MKENFLQRSLWVRNNMHEIVRDTHICTLPNPHIDDRFTVLSIEHKGACRKAEKPHKNIFCDICKLGRVLSILYLIFKDSK